MKWGLVIGSSRGAGIGINIEARLHLRIQIIIIFVMASQIETTDAQVMIARRIAQLVALIPSV